MGCLEGYLGLFEAILRHLGGTESFLENPVQKKMDPIFGTQLCILFVVFGKTFWITFWTLVGALLGYFGHREHVDCSIFLDIWLRSVA